MPVRTYTADQPYQRYAMVSGDIKFNPAGSHIITPNMGWQKVPESRWLWLLDGMFYIEPNDVLTPAFPMRNAGLVVAPGLSGGSLVPALPIASIRRDLADAIVLLDRVEAALPKG